MLERPSATGSRNSKTCRTWNSKDYTAVAIAYAEDAIADKRGVEFNKWIRLAAKRFLRDLKRTQGKRPPFLYSPMWAAKACGFIERLPHVEGTWDSETIVLHPAHVFFVCNLFGFRNADGHRRFTSALLSVARKNAKSTLAAGILLCAFCLEPENGPQVISAATTGSQARIVFGIAKRMVERCTDLRLAFDLEPFANSVARYEVGGIFKPINAKASTQDGLNPSHTSLDEIHAHKTHDLLNVLRSAAGARRAPLFLYTTTEGFENPGPWAELRGFAQQILNRLVDADHFLALCYGLDDTDDDFTERSWIKANPLMQVNSVLLAEVRKEAIEAKSMPGRLAEFRIKRLNRPSAAAGAWVDLRRWRECNGPVDLSKMRGLTCYGGLDLAQTTDMASRVLLWKEVRKGSNRWYANVKYWVPRAAVAARTERRSVPYQGWVDAGLVTLIEGDTIDFDVIERQIVEDYRTYGFVGMAYDPWNATALATRCTDVGVPMLAFIQGAKSYTPAMKACEAAYKARALNHGGNPVLTWNMANVVPIYDTNLNLRPDRKRSADKIDGACSLFMAFGLADVPDVNRFAPGFFAAPVVG